MYGNLPQTILFDENNPPQMANRENFDYELAKQRQNLAHTLKTPPSTGKSGSRRIASATGFASNIGIPKRPHSGANPKQLQTRDNSNGPAPSAK